MEKEIIIDTCLTLEQVSKIHLEEFFSLCEIIKSQQMDYLPEMIRVCPTLKKTESCLENYQLKYKYTGAPDFFIKYNHKITGVIGFHPWEKKKKTGEMAFWVSPEHQRLGIITKSINFLTDYSFNYLGLDKIELLIEPENIPSLNLAKKCGFQLGSDRIERSENGPLLYKNYFKGPDF